MRRRTCPVGRSERCGDDAPSRCFGCAVENEQRNPMSLLGAQSQERTIQTLTSRVLALWVRPPYHVFIARAPGILQNRRAVARRTERKHVVHRETEKHRGQEIAAGQGLETITPVVDLFAPPEMKWRRRNARMIVAVCL